MIEKPFIGIDLGTTFSAIAHINEFGKAEIIPNSDNEWMTPSVILFDGPEVVTVGTIARQNALAEPDMIVEFVKREMGKTVDEYHREFYGKIYSAEELSAFILKSLKNDAEIKLGAPINAAVITVPAYFNDSQRTATIEAGRIAGLNVLRIINEPTAAALAYGVHKRDISQNVLVFDLGGGTFDVTVMRIENDNIQMLTTNGDHMLGGKDWDDAIIEYVASVFEEEYGENPLNDLQAYQDLQARGIQAKHNLTIKAESQLFCSYRGNVEKVSLTRSKFEELTQNMVERCKSLIDIVLEDSSLRPAVIDTVLLTGGATRMPMVHDMLCELFGKEPDSSVNPDEVVALGAAIQGAMLQTRKGLAPAKVAKMLGRLASIDINPHSLGFVTIKDGELHNSKIIPKNTPIPCEQKRSDYTTSRNNQTSLDVYLVQGEDNDPRYCTLLGAYEIYDIPPRPAKKARMEITFKYNLNTVVELEAKDLLTGTILPKRVKKEEVDLENLITSASPPQDIALLVDSSGSMSGIIEHAKQAAYSFLDRIGSGARVGLISFGDPNAHIRAGLTYNFAELKRKIESLRPSGSTPMAEAITLSDKELLKHEGVINIIVLLTDGEPNSTSETMESARQAKNRGIRIITVGVGGGVDSELLKQIASISEDYHFVDEAFEIESAFVNIATELSGGIMKS